MTSPAKRLGMSRAAQAIENDAAKDLATLPAFELPKPCKTSSPRARRHGKNLDKSRKDIPKRKSVNNISKPSLKNAVKLAKSRAAVRKAVEELENDFYANSSRAAKRSKRKTVSDVLKAGGLSFPLTPQSLKFIAGTLRETGYKSAYSYVVEAKVEHIERGHSWTALLDRHFKLCIKASKRGVGPRKKAKEVPEDVWNSSPLLPDSSEDGTKVRMASHLFACGTHWMLREIELSNIIQTG